MENIVTKSTLLSNLLKVLNKLRVYIENLDLTKANVLDLPSQATDQTLGTIKLNPDDGVTLNASGQLNVAGRMGTMSSSTGIYFPQDIQPASVADGSLLITEASGTTVGAKTLAVTTGKNLTCRSAAAGSTVYRIQNKYENRIDCAALALPGAVAALSEAEAKLGKFANVVSVKINNASFTPDSTANNTSEAYDIVVTLDKTINPSSATTTLRIYPPNSAFSTVHAGQGIGSGSAGASVIVGQGVNSHSGNACNLVGAQIYNTGNGNAVFGRQHISKKNRWFIAGTGHDNSNGRSESGMAVGDWSSIISTTVFAIGNGTSHTSRGNIFEVRNNNGTELILRSPNGSSFKITVSDAGALTATKI